MGGKKEKKEKRRHHYDQLQGVIGDAPTQKATLLGG